MPIIHFINNKSQTTAGMKSVLNYVAKEEKTRSEDKRFVTTLGCSQQTCYDEMMATKNIFHKNEGRMFYHLVQSFPKGYDISAELAHRIACEFASKAFSDYECVVATHIDREHIHSHFVINSVSFQSGLKYHSNKNTVRELMNLSDEICLKYGVDIITPYKKKSERQLLSDREYRCAVKGQSWKFQLMNVISEVMKAAKSKKQFEFLMKQYGYSVRWETERKYITYTCPNGKKCRDNKLHDNKYSKEMMENEFTIRYEILNGEEQVGVENCTGHSANDSCAGTELAGINQSNTESMHSNRQSESANSDVREYSFGVNDGKTDGGLSDQSGGNIQQSDGELQNNSIRHSEKSSDLAVRTELTGWEDERGILLTAETARRISAQATLENHQNDTDFTIGTDDIIGGISALGSIIVEDDVDDCPAQVDRKEWEKIARKKEELGLKM